MLIGDWLMVIDVKLCPTWDCRPATSQGRWLADLVHFCDANDVALDFLSTHSYPTDPPNGRWNGGAGRQADTPHQLLAMQFAAKQAQQLNKPLWITEWSSDPGSRSPYHDTTDTAAYIVSSVAVWISTHRSSSKKRISNPLLVFHWQCFA